MFVNVRNDADELDTDGVLYSRSTLLVFGVLQYISVCLALILNLIVFFIFALDKKHFKVCFYCILNLFAFVVVVNCIGTLSSYVLRDIGLDNSVANTMTMTINLFTCYLSSFLIFLASFNRMIAFNHRVMCTVVFSHRKIRVMLFFLFCFSVALTEAFMRMTGMKRVINKQTGTMMDTATDCALASAVAYIVYFIPIVSSVFYLMVYLKMRTQRADAVSDKTRNMLTRAENCTLKIGVILLSTYAICLAVHVALDLSMMDVVLARVNGIVSTFPQLGLAASLLLCNTHMQDAIADLSRFSFSRRSSLRVGSAATTRSWKEGSGKKNSTDSSSSRPQSGPTHHEKINIK